MIDEPIMDVAHLGDICFQLLRRSVDAAANLLPGEFGKPALDLIDP